jgi:hypothetical protein
VLHIIAIAWYTLALKINLISPMLTGKKKVEATAQIPHSKPMIALLLAIVVGIFVYWLVVINPPTVGEFYY